MAETPTHETTPAPHRAHSPEKGREGEVSKSRETKEKARQVPESLREAFKAAADVAISRIMSKVASKEGMPTDAKTYRAEIIAVLKETDARLPEGHALKGTTDLIVENFLTPEEKGAELVRTMLEKGYSVAKEGTKLTAGPKEYDAGMGAIRSTLGFSIDLAKKKPEKIGEFMNEIKKVPEAANLLSRFPDLETVLVKILPEIAKNVDKQSFLAAFDSFASEIRTPALSLLAGKELGDKERGEVAMKIAHESARLVGSALTKETVKSGIEGISTLSLVKNNPIASKLVELVKRPELSDDDRLSLVKKANEGIMVFTHNPPNEAELEKYANSAAELVSSLSNKLPKALVTDVMTAMFRPEDGGTGKGVEIKSKTELVKLLFDNKAKLFEALKRYATGELSTMRDVVRFVVEERVLEQNIGLAKGELVERLKKVVEIDLASFSEKLKAKLSAEMAKNEPKAATEAEPQTALRDALSNKVLSEMAATFFWPDRPARITKELLADRASKAAASAIDSMPGNTVKIGGAEVPKHALKAAVTSIEFRLFAADAFAKLAGEAGKSGASMEKLASIVAEIMKDPLGNKYVGDRTRQFAIDAFYAMPASDIAETVSNNLESSGLAKYLKKPDGALAFDKRDVTEMVNILRDGEILPKETLSKLLSKENLTPPVNVLKVLKDLLGSLSKEQLTLLLDKVSAKRPDGSPSLLQKGLSIERKGGGPMTKEDVVKIAEIVMETSGKTDADSRKSLFEAVWADPKTAEYGLSFFKNFGKERVMKLVSDHPDVFGDIFSGKIDPKRDAARLIPVGIDIAYASDFASDSKMVADTKAAFPEMKGLLEMEVFWGTAAEHLDRLRHAVPKEKALAFANAHSADLASLASNFDKAKAAKLGSEFLLSVDREKLTVLADPAKLSGAEKLAAEKLPQIRDALESFKKETVTDPDGKTVSRLDALIDAGTAASDGKLDKAYADFLAGEAFELVSRLLPALGDWKIPEGGGETPEAAKRFKKEFVSNNLGFVIGQALPYLFGRPTEKIMGAYFADAGNKGAFVKTLSATMVGKG